MQSLDKVIEIYDFEFLSIFIILNILLMFKTRFGG